MWRFGLWMVWDVIGFVFLVLCFCFVLFFFILFVNGLRRFFIDVNVTLMVCAVNDLRKCRLRKCYTGTFPTPQRTRRDILNLILYSIGSQCSFIIFQVISSQSLEAPWRKQSATVVPSKITAGRQHLIAVINSWQQKRWNESVYSCLITNLLIQRNCRLRKW